MQIRKARLCDAGEIHALIQPYVAEGTLLPRSLGYICEHIRDFTVIESAGRIIGCGALHFINEDLAEVQSLAVHPAHQGHGLGQWLVHTLLDEARDYQAWKAFALTSSPEFFFRLGFHPTDLTDLPQKLTRDCFGCPKFAGCTLVPVICDVFAGVDANVAASRSRHQTSELVALRA
jgi:amino-acid N-acetyltransferase